MITGGSGSGDTGRPAKPDLGGKQTKASRIKATSFPTVKGKANKPKKALRSEHKMPMPMGKAPVTNDPRLKCAQPSKGVL